MKNLKMVNKKNESKMIYKLYDGQMVDRKQLECIHIGKMQNIIEMTVNQKKKSGSLEYYLSGMITLSDFLGMIPVNRKLLSGMLKQIIDFLKMLQMNPLDVKNVCFDIDKVMIVPAKQKLMFIYTPVYPCAFDGNVVGLMQNFLLLAQFSAYEDSSYVNELIELVNQGKNMSMYELELYVEKIRNVKAAMSSEYISENKRCFKCHALIRRGDIYCFSCGVRLNTDEGVPYVLRRKNQEKIYMEIFPFYIGKIAGKDRYFITDNPLISRTHARIEIQNEHYYICDVGSTNGIYMNGLRIPINERYELNHGTVFLLADEEFIFYN